MFRVLLLLLLVAVPALAVESAAVRSPRLTATLISDSDAVEAGTPFRVALRLRMAPGWHAYWRNPGDAGAPPEVTLTLPQGTIASGIAWPTPKRLPEGPVMTYAYTGEVVLPITVTPGAGPQTIEAAATWLVCEKICVPEEGSFRLTLPAGPASASAEAPLFASAEARLPRPSPFEARIAPDGILSLAGAGLSPASVAGRVVLSRRLGPDRARRAAARVRVGRGGGDRAEARQQLRALCGGRGYDGAAGPEGAGKLPRGIGRTWAGSAGHGRAAAGAGLAVGIPGRADPEPDACVFPVLAMKAMALARMSGQARSAIRAHAVSYTAGVLAAFGVLAGAVLAARAAGGGTGWGFQFQSPVFVAAMAWVLFAVGLNLSGVFQVGTKLAGAGQGLTEKGGHGGSFFTGLLAVLVATPCTAPFMGAAVAAALVAPAPVTVLVFLALGLGMAAPYALLALAPGLARALPRPGPWMDVLKGALAFPMYAASAWLIWVVSLQAGPLGVLATGAGMVLVGFAAWSFGLAQTAGRSGQRWGHAAAWWRCWQPPRRSPAFPPSRPERSRRRPTPARI